MKKIIFSFSPKVFPALCTGNKWFEYRSRMTEGSVEAYIYLSSPIKMIVGKLDLAPKMSIQDFITTNNPRGKLSVDLKKHILEGSNYFSPIKSLKILETPVSLKQAKELSSNFFAPQGYTFLERYPELKAVLESRIYIEKRINPFGDFDKLGLFSSEIISTYQKEIVLPVYLQSFFGRG